MIWPQTLETGEIPQGRPLQKLYRFLGAPHYFLIGRDGRILASDVHKPAEVVRIVEQQVEREGGGSGVFAANYFGDIDEFHCGGSLRG